MESKTHFYFEILNTEMSMAVSHTTPTIGLMSKYRPSHTKLLLLDLDLDDNGICAM